jgi:uncharacterized iron-regulated protein
MTRRQILAAGAAFVAGEVQAAKPGTWSKEWKIVESLTGKEIRPRDLPGRLAHANVIFVGEQHDDPETHRAELAILAALQGKFGERLTLAMEMFERDNQGPLTDYVTGKTDEAGFTHAARFWKNYPTDYRPLIEFAREKHVPVIASNAPQVLVRRVSKDGLAALSSMTPEERTLTAAYINAPEGDEYAHRFAAVIGQGHSEGGEMDAAMVRRFYEAQCVRDDTMAESIVREIDAGRTVLHINGSFHSDAGLGTAARVLWRRPLAARITVIKVIAGSTDTTAKLPASEGDYLILVPQIKPEAKSTS